MSCTQHFPDFELLKKIISIQAFCYLMYCDFNRITYRLIILAYRSCVAYSLCCRRILAFLFVSLIKYPVSLFNNLFVLGILEGHRRKVWLAKKLWSTEKRGGKLEIYTEGKKTQMINVWSIVVCATDDW